MKSVVYHNDGLIPLDALRIMGVNVKDKVDAVGYFGTGAKYAISIFLSLGHSVKLIRDGEELVFSLREKDIRGKIFSVVHMNDEQLSYTSELGKNWEPWQAFREFYCNALDENGSVELLSDEEILELDTQGRTLIIVQGKQAEEEFYKRHEIVLNGVKPHMTFEKSECYRNNTGSNWLYYRGVRVHQLSYVPKYIWNVTTELELTEDRTLKYIDPATRQIATSIHDSQDKRFIKSCLVNDKDDEEWFEYKLQFYHLHRDPTDEFLEVCSEAIDNNIMHLSSGAVSKYHDINGVPMPEDVELSSIEQQTLDECIEFVESLGYPMKTYPIVVANGLGNDVLGLAHNDTIIMSHETFRRGKKMVAAALIEEYTHLSTGYHDETRELQTKFLLDIINIGEKFVKKSPL